MKTGTVTKLLFTGIASGIALSCAIVLATSVTTVSSNSTQKADKPVVRSAADPKADREPVPAVAQEVERGGKSDALAITLAILKGEGIAPDAPLPFANEPETVTAETPDATTPVDEPPDDGLRLSRAPDAEETVDAETVNAPTAVVETVEVPEQVIPAPRTRTVNPVRITETIGDPVSIIPDAEPVENQPVAAPTTTTNFTTEPVTSLRSLRNRTDLAR